MQRTSNATAREEFAGCLGLMLFTIATKQYLWHAESIYEPFNKAVNCIQFHIIDTGVDPPASYCMLVLTFMRWGT